MSSSIGWIDFSSEHRERVRTVLGLLSAPGVIDELGIGVIRDTFADRMFPGISTIQTRAKYFTLTALLLKRYEKQERGRRKPRALERFLEEEERTCRIKLVEHHGGGDEAFGIIGATFGTDANRGVVRRPSSVYWNGLREFGIVSPRHLSLAEFGRRLADDGLQLRSLLEDSAKEKGDDPDAEAEGHRLRIHVPDVEETYWGDLSIDLTPSEAEFIWQHITHHQRGSLTGQLLLNEKYGEQLLGLADAGFDEFADLPFINELEPEELQRTVHHARDFWRIMEGAHIRYNCLLQEAGLGTESLREEFDAEWERWRSDIATFPGGWDSEFMWSLVSNHRSRVRGHTKTFIENWIGEARQGASNTARCDDLVRVQEKINKGRRARLRPGHKEAVSGRVGFAGLNYRLAEVRQIVTDITEGRSS